MDYGPLSYKGRYVSSKAFKSNSEYQILFSKQVTILMKLEADFSDNFRKSS